MFKIACYGVRENEEAYFNDLNKYDYDLTLYSEYLVHDNVDTAKGHDAVLLRGNCVADATNLEKFNEYGIKYVFTRTVGFNHIDVDKAKELGMKVARVPGYSPNAIAELSLTFGMTLLRNVQYTAHQTSIEKDFRVTPRMFSREIRNCTVGIIGTGRIGLTEAKLFKGLGANVLGYDIFESDAAKEVVDFVELDDLLAQSDIVSIHVPLVKGENEGMVNEKFISKMRDDAILINTARGELQDNQAIIKAIKEDKLYGFAADVLPGESEIFFKQFDDNNPVPRPDIVELMDLYPRVLLTPHVGSNTDEALTNMIEISYDNFNDVLTQGSSSNEL